MIRKLEWRTPINYGWGLIDDLGNHLPAGDCFLVLGGSSSEGLDLEGRARKAVKGELRTFKGIEPNPTDLTVESGAEAMKAASPDYILAMGGGSVMDAAKVMALIAAHGGTVKDYVTKKTVPMSPGFPVHCVPTTPGTSSEITPFAVVTVPSLGNKMALRHPAIYPRAALIDPSLTLHLPRVQTASTGLDVLAHAIESFWSRYANPITKGLSLRSVALVRRHLERACSEPASREHREGMSIAGIFAGMSFSQVGTGICHAISYPITMDASLPHGMACALTLGVVFDLQAERGAEGLDEVAQAFGSSIGSFREDLRSMMERIGAPTTLAGAGFKGGTVRVLSTDMSELLSNSPEPFSDDDIRRILDAVSE